MYCTFFSVLAYMVLFLAFGFFFLQNQCLGKIIVAHLMNASLQFAFCSFFAFGSSANKQSLPFTSLWEYERACRQEGLKAASLSSATELERKSYCKAHRTQCL